MYLGIVHAVPVGDAPSLTRGNYALIKAIFEELPSLQLELTICDEDGNLLVIIKNDGHPLQIAWEFMWQNRLMPSQEYMSTFRH